MKKASMPNTPDLIMYQTEDGQTRLEVTLTDNTVWLTLDQMSELFAKAKSTISEHIRNIYLEQELPEGGTMRKFGNSEFSTKPTNFYNLDVIISVGYRVKSVRGTQFRIWATSRLREYITKGFVLNDELLKAAGGGAYFDELLERIRDIRSSEKVFWRKVLDIYATSVDYDPAVEGTLLFFRTVQNKMHWEAHGQTAAEKIYYSADSAKPNMGLLSFTGSSPRKSDAVIAKNYCNAAELEALNGIVSAYLEFAEMQARRRIPITMKDWIETLDGFLKLSKHEILSHAGKISAAMAEHKAAAEYEKYRQLHLNDLSRVEEDYIRLLEASEKKLSSRSQGDKA